MLFYTQAQLEYSAQCCQKHLAILDRADDVSDESYLAQFIHAENLQPRNLEAHITHQQRGELRATYHPLTPLADQFFNTPVKLAAPFIVEGRG